MSSHGNHWAGRVKRQCSQCRYSFAVAVAKVVSWRQCRLGQYNSGVYHYKGERYFGSTKQGKFVWEKDALREGDRATRNGQ